MAFAWTIGKFFNIPVRLHYSMLLLLFTLNWITGSGPERFISWAILIGLVFGSILLHEVGHALAARRYGIQTLDIILTPIGGIARLAGMPKDPRQEILIAIAGPAVSFVLFFVFSFGADFLAQMEGPQAAIGVVADLRYVNLALGLFNLIPALPMDGGRVLRGLLALKYDHLTATRKAARFARFLAVGGGAFALIGSSMGYFQFSWTYLIIAAFVYFTAGMELRMAQIRAYQQQAEEQANRPFDSRAGGPKVTYTRSWNYDSKQPNSPPAASDDWEVKSRGRNGRVVVQGGKAEILSRNDPEKKEP